MSTGAGFSPPQLYSEWMVLLDGLGSGEIRLIARGDLKQAALRDAPHMLGALEQHMADTVNILLKRYTRQFSRVLNEAIEDGDLSNAAVLLRRASADAELCRFYRDIPFLPSAFAEELDGKVVDALKRYHREVSVWLEDAAESTGSSELEDLAYELRRLRIIKE